MPRKRKRPKPAPPKPRPGSRDAALARRRQEQDLFLDALSKVGTVVGACQHTSIGRRTHYDWLEKDPTGYGKRYEEAIESATDNLETEARRRAMVGVDEPIYYKGKKIDSVRKYSDVLLIALLNAYRPQRFKHRHDVSGKVLVQPDLSRLSAEELEQLEQLRVKIDGEKAADEARP